MSLITQPAEPDGIDRLSVSVDYPSRDIVVRIAWTLHDRRRFVIEAVITAGLLDDEQAGRRALDALVEDALIEYAPRVPGLASAPHVVQLLIPESLR